MLLDFGCLHHQRKPNWPAYLAGVRRVLMPGGHCLLTVFSPRFWFFRGGRSWHIAEGAHRPCFTRREVLDLFGRDLEVLQMEEERGAGRGFWHVWMRTREPS
jgi:hypothetical protein